ncbi:hypothetical protein [Pseudotabrizicola formosa]|uniref:hypothetical protein n=1 Tax=Pseudotabrizicola formosa TaxID=2030009 RepID=UPI000CD2E799|nr:hypothetical protein [Pseudotabrizicola formosa]
MFNPLPFLALAAVALGYSGAIDRVESRVQPTPVAAFSATPNLSVQDYVAALPETLQDPLCGARDVITADLSQAFAETFEASVEHEPGVSLEVWASDMMGTWTVVHVEHEGLACIVSSGFGWEEGMTAADVLQDRPLS